MLIVYLTPSIEVAGVVGMLLNQVFFMFGGFNPPSNAIPVGYKWLQDKTPQRFAISILSALRLLRLPVSPLGTRICSCTPTSARRLVASHSRTGR